MRRQRNVFTGMCKYREKHLRFGTTYHRAMENSSPLVTIYKKSLVMMSFLCWSSHAPQSASRCSKDCRRRSAVEYKWSIACTNLVTSPVLTANTIIVCTMELRLLLENMNGTHKWETIPLWETRMPPTNRFSLEPFLHNNIDRIAAITQSAKVDNPVIM